MIKENVNHLGCKKECSISKTTVLTAIRKLTLKNEKFDIIFLDPPYDEINLDDLNKIVSSEILNQNGIIVLEHSSNADIKKDGLDKLECFYEKKYSYISLSFFRM